MKHIENIEDRVDHVVQRIIHSTERRDHMLDEVSTLVRDYHKLQACLTEVEEVRYHLLPAYVDKCAGLARAVESSAMMAEHSSRTIKRLDALLRRVQETTSTATAMMEMEDGMKTIPRALEDGDMEKTVELLKTFDDARQALCRGKKEADQNDKFPMHGAEVSHVTAEVTGANDDTASRGHLAPLYLSSQAHESIQVAKVKTQEQLRRRISDAIASNDKLTIMQCTRLLAALGCSSEGCSLYCCWICDHTISALKKLVDRELHKMNNPTEAALSHLTIVSQALDTVAATFEAEEEFTAETFGKQGPLKLLTELHHKSTAQCVPVLRDFMEKRRSILTDIQHILDRTRCPATAPGPPPATASGMAMVSSASHKVVSPTSITADTRKADQILEEMSHLVSCCHLYLTFAARKQSEYESKGATTSSVDSSSSTALDVNPASSEGGSLWTSPDNPLLQAVQEILFIYVPLQQGYFEVAFAQALQLQVQALRGAPFHSTGKQEAALTNRSGGYRGQPTGASHGGSRPSSSATGVNSQGYRGASTVVPRTLPLVGPQSSFMTGLTKLYTAATTATGSEGSEASREGEEEEECYTTSENVVTLPDDVFFFLRMAMHRAMHTTSAQITSAVMVSCTDVIQRKLLPEVEKRATLRRHDFVPPSVLHWIGAGQMIVDYTTKLAQELRQLASSQFVGKDELRLKEQAQDLDTVGREMLQLVHGWLQQCAHVCFTTLFPPHRDRLQALSYRLNQEMLYHFELNDPWVQTCLVDLGASLEYLEGHLDNTSFDNLLVRVAEMIMRQVEEVLLQKQVTTFGALQVDKDIRSLRAFFMNKAHEVSVRDCFARLTSISTLWLCDRPRDAEDEVMNNVLSSDEKRKVLLCRVDFNQAEVMALRL